MMTAWDSPVIAVTSLSRSQPCRWTPSPRRKREQRDILFPHLPSYRMKTPPDNFETALELAEKGYIPVAMLPGLKVPAEDRWNEWADRAVTEESILRRWQGNRNGVAILCKDLIVLDVDAEDRLDTVLEKCGLKNSPICRTPGGGYHVHARMRRGVE